MRYHDGSADASGNGTFYIKFGQAHINGAAAQSHLASTSLRAPIGDAMAGLGMAVVRNIAHE